ncbi:hypothetical protein U14_05508 [Candidatus Moduliflexus flocculans]|uniref:Cobyrinic acid ac-diamide synthase n=1 Tax=Candidatus Moduliflexus flocculans TaxID=1499966 RepID=A0A081BS48_9BACT|nr:hypothetical protein U14_05508 [Candidatus Moduliflexus flocculans]
MRIIAIANQKGGCGKTTVAINLSACLARQGRRTLLVDMDPQGHCGVGLAVPEEQVARSIYEVLTDQTGVLLSDVLWQIAGNFDLAPSTSMLARVEQELAGAPDQCERLTRALLSVTPKYDYCIIDCPPSTGLLTGNALYASSEVIVPVDTGYFSLYGLTRQIEAVSRHRNQTGRELLVHILPNLYDVRTKHAREVLAELRKKYGKMVFNTQVNFNTKIREATSYGQPIVEYAPASPGHRDFMRLTNELIAEGEVDTTHHVLLEQASQLAHRADQLLATSQVLIGDVRLGDIVEATPEEIDRKISRVYGVSHDEQGVHFCVHAPGAQRVQLAADFNNWSPQATELESKDQDGSFAVTLSLGPGRYRYRYVIDGRWTKDPHNDYVECNPYGELNSIVEVA